MKFALVVMAATLVSLSASAETANWSLVKQTQGPTQTPCPEQIKTTADNQIITLQGGDFYEEISDLNQGVLCHKQQNGSPFGHLTCALSTLEAKGGKRVYGRQQCSSDNPFRSSCDPSQEEFSLKITISGNTLTYRALINWQDDPFLECAYQKN